MKRWLGTLILATVVGFVGRPLRAAAIDEAAAHTPPPGSPERQAICDGARAYVLEKYANGSLPQPVVFKIEHLLVAGRFANMEAVAIFKDGSSAIPKYLPDIVFNFCLEHRGDGWRVVADLSRTDVPDAKEIAQIRSRLPSDFPMTVLSPSWRDLLNANK
jgi:hypothetical protein